MNLDNSEKEKKLDNIIDDNNESIYTDSDESVSSDELSSDDENENTETLNIPSDNIITYNQNGTEKKKEGVKKK